MVSTRKIVASGDSTKAHVKLLTPLIRTPAFPTLNVAELVTETTAKNSAESCHSSDISSVQRPSSIQVHVLSS